MTGKKSNSNVTASKLTYDNFIAVLLKTVPAIKTMYEKHLKLYGNVLPHVLMGDITRFTVNLCNKSRQHGKDSGLLRTLSKILKIFEDAIVSSDSKLQELISVSFLENLDSESKVYNKIKKLLGPHLKKEMQIYEK